MNLTAAEAYRVCLSPRLCRLWCWLKRHGLAKEVLSLDTFRAIVFAIVFAVVFANTADARGRRSRGRTNYVQSYSVAAIAGGPQAVAEAKADLLASRNAGFHPGGGMGGANAEGWGFSSRSAQAALDSCCYSGQRTVAGQAVARGARGWYAIRLYW